MSVAVRAARVGAWRSANEAGCRCEANAIEVSLIGWDRRRASPNLCPLIVRLGDTSQQTINPGNRRLKSAAAYACAATCARAPSIHCGHLRHGEDRRHVGGGGTVVAVAAKVGNVGAKARGDRRVHRIGSREFAEQERPAAAEPRATLPPKGDDAADVGLDRLRHRFERVVGEDLHRALPGAAPRTRNASRPTRSAPARAPAGRPATDALSGCCSARYSRMARLSHIARSPSSNSGTRPDGLYLRISALDSGCRSRTLISSNGKPRWRMASHGPQAPARPIFVADDQAIAICRHALALPSVILSCRRASRPDNLPTHAPLGLGLPAASIPE